MKIHLLGRFVYPAAALVCFSPLVSSAFGLFMGLALALMIENPYLDQGKKWSPRFLMIAVIGLGAGMNLEVVTRAGLHGIGYTVVGISVTVLLGQLLGHLLRTDDETSILITMGTAICGGSAIAAIAPVIRAKNSSVTVALGTVFSLNSIALFVFPLAGRQLGLSENQFGLWSALAIHDTSSVVGAALQFGPRALEVATSVKLARALWIVPSAFLIGKFCERRNQDSSREPSVSRAKRPWFILGFVLAAAVMTFVPELQQAGQWMEFVAKRLMVLTLFLIGSSLNLKVVRAVGWRPFAQGLVLWLLMASFSLFAILENWIT